MPGPSPQPRPLSTVSIAASDTTYHSFCDVEFAEPQSPRKQKKQTSEPSPASYEMRRQDSGYESMASPQNSPRGSLSQQRRRTSMTSSTPSSTYRHRPRPTTRRSTRSERAARISRMGVHSPCSSVSRRQIRPWDEASYFHFPHFPSPSPDQTPSLDPNQPTPPSPLTTGHTHPDNSPPPIELPPHPVPPQTTHYWTSDRTRRLEYAAIDAASKGVRGWVMRHVVPDCFIPKDRRRVRFEDDSGSVVRYRLSLEMDEEARREEETHQHKKRRGWWVSIRAR